MTSLNCNTQKLTITTAVIAIFLSLLFTVLNPSTAQAQTEVLFSSSIQNLTAENARSKSDYLNLLKHKSCHFPDLAFPGVEDSGEYLAMLKRSGCEYLPRAIDTWTRPPNWNTIERNISRIESGGNEYVLGMFLAEAISTSAVYSDDNGYQFDFSSMCRTGSEGSWGSNTCIPDTSSTEYIKYLEYVIPKAMDYGIRDFQFGQTGRQDPQRNLPTLVNNMREVAAEKGITVLFGHQPNGVRNVSNTYLRSFDYLKGPVCLEGSSSGGCAGGDLRNRVLGNTNRGSVVISEIDWWDAKGKRDDIHLYTQLSKEERKDWMLETIKKHNAAGAGFTKPFRIPLNGGAVSGACFGFNEWIYNASNKYDCGDEDFINEFLSGVVTTQPTTPVSVDAVEEEIAIGKTVMTTDNLLVRVSPGSTVIDTVRPGTTGEVISGPRAQGGYTWWRVRYSPILTGWSASEWLTLDTSGEARDNVRDRVDRLEEVNKIYEDNFGRPVGESGIAWWVDGGGAVVTGPALESLIIDGASEADVRYMEQRAEESRLRELRIIEVNKIYEDNFGRPVGESGIAWWVDGGGAVVTGPALESSIVDGAGGADLEYIQRREEESRLAEEARVAELLRQAAELQAQLEAQQAEEERLAELERIAEEERQAEIAQQRQSRIAQVNAIYETNFGRPVGESGIAWWVDGGGAVVTGPALESLIIDGASEADVRYMEQRAEESRLRELRIIEVNKIYEDNFGRPVGESGIAWWVDGGGAVVTGPALESSIVDGAGGADLEYIQRREEESRLAEEARVAELLRQAAELQAQLEAQQAEEERLAELERIAEEERQAELLRQAAELQAQLEAQQAEEERLAELERIAEEERQAELLRQAAELQAQLEAQQAEEERLAELERIAEEERQAELERVAAELERVAAEEAARVAEEERQAELLRQAAELQAQLEAQQAEEERLAELERIAEEERQAELERVAAELERVAAEEAARVAEEERQAELLRQAAELQAQLEAQQAEEERLAELERIAEEERQAEIAQQRQSRIAQVNAIYETNFGRPVGESGIAWWVDGGGAVVTGPALESLIIDGASEADVRYMEQRAEESRLRELRIIEVNKIYEDNFGRPVGESGIAWWVDGGGAVVTGPALESSIVDGAGGADLEYIQRREEESRLAEEARVAELLRQAAELQAQLEAQQAEEERLAELERIAEEERQAELERVAAELERVAAEEAARVAEEERQAELLRQAAELQAQLEAQQAEEERLAELERIAEEERQAEIAQQRQSRIAQVNAIYETNFGRPVGESGIAWWVDGGGAVVTGPALESLIIDGASEADVRYMEQRAEESRLRELRIIEVNKIYEDNFGRPVGESGIAWWVDGGGAVVTGPALESLIIDGASEADVRYMEQRAEADRQAELERIAEEEAARQAELLREASGVQANDLDLANYFTSNQLPEGMGIALLDDQIPHRTKTETLSDGTELVYVGKNFGSQTDNYDILTISENAIEIHYEVGESSNYIRRFVDRNDENSAYSSSPTDKGGQLWIPRFPELGKPYQANHAIDFYRVNSPDDINRTPPGSGSPNHTELITWAEKVDVPYSISDIGFETDHLVRVSQQWNPCIIEQYDYVEGVGLVNWRALEKTSCLDQTPGATSRPFGSKSELEVQPDGTFVEVVSGITLPVVQTMDFLDSGQEADFVYTRGDFINPTYNSLVPVDTSWDMVPEFANVNVDSLPPVHDFNPISQLISVVEAAELEPERTAEPEQRAELERVPAEATARVAGPERQAEEVARIAEETRQVEQARIAQEEAARQAELLRQAAELQAQLEAQQAEEERLAELERIAEEERQAELERVAAEEAARVAEEERQAELLRQAAELQAQLEAQQAEEERLAELERIAEEERQAELERVAAELERVAAEEAARVAEEERQAELLRQAAELQAQLEAQQAEEERLAELERIAEEERQAELERVAAELERVAAEEAARVAEEERQAELLRQAAELQAQLEAQQAEEERLAELERIAEEERQAELLRQAAELQAQLEAQQAEEERLAELERIAEEERQAELLRQAAELQAQLEAQQAEEERLAELERIAEEERQAELERVAAELERVAAEEAARVAEEERQAELLRQAAELQAQLEAQQAEEERLAELERIAEEERQAELERVAAELERVAAEEAARVAEEERQAELLRQAAELQAQLEAQQAEEERQAELERVAEEEAARVARYTIYLNNEEFQAIDNVSESFALQRCQSYAKNYERNFEVHCTWGDKEVYRSDSSQITNAARRYIVYRDDKIISNRQAYDRARSLSNCQTLAARYTQSEIYCTWGDEEIYRATPDPEPVVEITASTRDTLRTERNGRVNTIRPFVTRSQAIYLCYQSAKGSLSYDFRCEWSGEEIFKSDLPSDPEARQAREVEIRRLAEESRLRIVEEAAAAQQVPAADEAVNDGEENQTNEVKDFVLYRNDKLSLRNRLSEVQADNLCRRYARVFERRNDTISCLWGGEAIYRTPSESESEKVELNQGPQADKNVVEQVPETKVENIPPVANSADRKSFYLIRDGVRILSQRNRNQVQADRVCTNYKRLFGADYKVECVWSDATPDAPTATELRASQQAGETESQSRSNQNNSNTQAESTKTTEIYVNDRLRFRWFNQTEREAERLCRRRVRLQSNRVVRCEWGKEELKLNGTVKGITIDSENQELLEQIKLIQAMIK